MKEQQQRLAATHIFFSGVAVFIDPGTSLAVRTLVKAPPGPAPILGGCPQLRVANQHEVQRCYIRVYMASKGDTKQNAVFKSSPPFMQLRRGGTEICVQHAALLRSEDAYSHSSMVSACGDWRHALCLLRRLSLPCAPASSGRAVTSTTGSF